MGSQIDSCAAVQPTGASLVVSMSSTTATTTTKPPPPPSSSTTAKRRYARTCTVSASSESASVSLRRGDRRLSKERREMERGEEGEEGDVKQCLTAVL